MFHPAGGNVPVSKLSLNGNVLGGLSATTFICMPVTSRSRINEQIFRVVFIDE